MEKTYKMLSVKDLSIAEDFYCGQLGRRIKERHTDHLLLDGGIVLQKAVDSPGQLTLSIKNLTVCWRGYARNPQYLQRTDYGVFNCMTPMGIRLYCARMRWLKPCAIWLMDGHPSR